METKTFKKEVRSGLRSSSSSWHFLILIIFISFISCIYSSLPSWAQAPTKNISEETEKDPFLIRLRGFSSLKKVPQDIVIAKLLLEFKNSEMGEADSKRFFQELAGRKITMFDVINTKKLLKEANMAEHFLGKEFALSGSPVEKALLLYRKQVTLDGINYVIKQFQGKGIKSNHGLYLAEIGNWTTQKAEALTFSGDIDFSFVSNDMELTWEMKKAFDDYIRARTGLEPTAFDSVCTAHGKATLDVYIGEHGKMYADKTMEEGKVAFLKKIDLKNGSLSQKIEDGEKVIEKMLIELDAAKSEAGLPVLKNSGEPGLSMEMVRHFNHDIVEPKIFDVVDSILKASKYLDRSNDALKGIPGAKPANEKLAKFVKEITAAKGKSDWDTANKLIKDYFGEALRAEIIPEGKRMVAKLKANADAIDEFFKKCTDSMWKNANAGFGYRLNDLRKKWGETEQKKLSQAEIEKIYAEMTSLKEMIEVELIAAEENHLKVPDYIIKLSNDLNAMVSRFSKRYKMGPITDENMKNKAFLEELIKNKRFKEAAAFVMHTVPSAFIDYTNYYLDYVDTKLMGSLRGEDQDLDNFLKETKETLEDLKDPKKKGTALEKVKSLQEKATQGIKKINTYLNDQLNKTAARRGAMKGLMAYNLYDELFAYRDAWYRGGYEELAMEYFRRRIPFFSAAENINMGNYYMAAWDTVTTFIPPLGLPVAALGIMKGLYDTGYNYYWSSELTLFVDNLYDSATFKLDKLEGVTTYENAKAGTWCLVLFEYQNKSYNVKDFANKKREQIDAMKQELKKPKKDRILYAKYHESLTDLMEVNKILKKNIMESNPLLGMTKEMMEHPAVAQKLKAQYGDLYETQWEQAKLNFVLETITRLEDRKAADMALGMGMLPDMFSELMKITGELQITEAINQAMDNELKTSHMEKMILDWLKDIKRDLLIQGRIETAVNRAAQIVRRNLDAYRLVLQSRTKAEALFAEGMPRDPNDLRMLTGKYFLTGRYDEDTKTAQQWLSQIEAIKEAVSGELIEIKSQVIKNAKLDSDYDKDTLKKVVFRDVMRKAWSDVFKKSESQSWKEAATTWARVHYDERQRIVSDFKKYYSFKEIHVVIAIDPDPAEKEKQVTLTAKPNEKLRKIEDLIYQWFDDTRKIRLGEGEIVTTRFSDAGLHKIRLEVSKKVKEKREKLTDAIQDLEVREKPEDDKEKADKEKAEREKAQKERAEKEQLEKERREREQQAKVEQERLAQERLERERRLREAQKPKEPLACSYEYTEWGECSRQAKKQTRSVVAKKPEGCVEKGRPHLEQECIPPPTEAEKRQNLLNCLCWCTEGGYSYNPSVCAQGKLPGVCHYVNIGGADVCRVMNPRNQECVVECYQTHYGKKPNTDELAQINRDIRAENRKNMKPLKVTLAPDAKPIRAQYGDIVKITSSAEGGMPGYTYSWRGNGEGKDNTFTFINTRQPGSYSVAVTVNDSDGNSATASITILVEAISIKVEKTSPTTETIPVGTKAQFRATVMSGDRPASGDFNYLWQPHPEIEFNPFEKSATTTAIFRKPGTYSIFVQAFKKVGGIDSTVGESNQVTITVVNPKWRLDFSPQDPLIGQEVKAKILPDISPEPDMKEMNFRWQLPSNAKQRTTSQDDLEITFILTDTNPANISCLASTKYDNQNLGGAGKTIRAQGYQVTISEPRYLESPPQIWHCDTQFGQAQRCGMVTVKPNQFAVFRDIFLNATVTPPPDSPRYRWTIDPPGSCGFPGAGSEIKLNCSSTGTYTARVEVTNTEGAKLGEASQPVTISISQETLDNSKKAKEAYEKLQKAKELVSQGKLDEAISLAEEAAKLDPKNHEASTLSNRWRTEKQTIQSQLNKVNSLITQIKFNEAEKELSFAKNLHPKYQPVINTEALLREKKEFFTKTIVEKLGRAKDLFAQQKISEAIKLTEEVLTVAPQNNEARNLMQQFREAKIRDDKAQELINEAWNLEKNRRYDEALKKYKEGYALVPNPEVQKRIVNLENLGNQAKRLLNEGFSHEKQGNIDEALKKYKEAQGIYPDDGVARKIAELEQKDRQASQLLQEGYQFEKSGKFLEAITKYRQAYQIVPNQQIANKIIELEKAMGEQGKKQQLANQLRNEGGAFEQRRMYREAIEKYQSAQQIIPEDRTAQKIADLKGQLKQEEQQKEREEQVQQLVNRGYQQEKQGDLKGALEKYKEANRIIFNSKVAEHITDLENKLSKPPTVTAATPPPSSGLMSPPSAGSGGVDGTWEVSFNNYRGKMELKWAGDKWSGRLWLDAHQRWEDLTNISYSSTTGRLEFTRPNPGVTQRYSGVLSAERLEGTFTQENTSTKYTWWAKRTQGSTSTQGPTPPSGSGRIAEAAWLGMGDDKVGMENMDRPNGVKDGHFRVVMDLPVNTEVNYISIHYSNVNGDKREHYWFSKSYTSWILGVFRNNVMLNPGRRSPLGRFSGRTVFDLYANNSGVFLPGNYFLIEVEAGGVISTRLVQVSASTSTPPSPPPAIKPTSSRIDPTGTWRNNPDATWKFTMGTDGRYFAQETGLGYASGPAYFTSSGTFRIDYKTRDGGYTGYFEIRFAPDGRTGSGNWQQFTPTPQSKSNVDWTRLQ